MNENMIAASFFSYKGGSGRSTTCWNTLPFIYRDLGASPDNPIVLIDADIDSAGLTYLLGCSDKFNKDRSVQRVLSQGVPGYTDIKSSTPLEAHELFSMMERVGDMFGVEKKGILFLGANLGQDAYDSYDTKNASSNFDKMRAVCKRYDCAAMISDTPAGTQMSANASLKNTNTIVCCMRPTFQFRKGTSDFLIGENARATKKRYVLCPTAVSRHEVTFNDNNFPEDISKLIELDVVRPVMEKLPETNELVTDMLNNTPKERRGNRPKGLEDAVLVGIPEIERFKWWEDCLSTLKDRSEDEILALERYELLASLVCNKGRSDGSV